MGQEHLSAERQPKTNQKGNAQKAAVALARKGENLISKSEMYRKQKEKAEAELVQCNHQIERLENRIHYYSDTFRKERAHHLITRGAAIESVAPKVKSLDAVEFYNRAAKIFSLPDVNTLVDAAVADHGADKQREE